MYKIGLTKHRHIYIAYILLSSWWRNICQSKINWWITVGENYVHAFIWWRRDEADVCLYVSLELRMNESSVQQKVTGIVGDSLTKSAIRVIFVVHSSRFQISTWLPELSACITMPAKQLYRPIDLVLVTEVHAFLKNWPLYIAPHSKVCSFCNVTAS